jgi:hypothetical protein
VLETLQIGSVAYDLRFQRSGDHFFCENSSRAAVRFQVCGMFVWCRQLEAGAAVMAALLLHIAVVVLAPTLAHAEVDCTKPPPDYYTADDLKKPMRFLDPEYYACLGNAVNNPYLAIGVITPDTPAAFAEFAKQHPAHAPIEFTSPGGNLLAGLQLGEQIRSGVQYQPGTILRECVRVCHIGRGPAIYRDGRRKRRRPR